MKKLPVLIPLLFLSCAKKEIVSENITSNDSLIENKMDSAANGIVSIDENDALKESFKKDRIVDGTTIIKIIDGNLIPVAIEDEFTNANQQMILKIKDFAKSEIVGNITPGNPQMNIRFNQIKLPDGTYDGPFGRDLHYDMKEKGEIWLIIGKSNMASGDDMGKFTIHIK